MAMELDIIKTQTTWNDAAASLNNNFSKVKQAIAMGGGSGSVDTEMSDTSTNPVQNKVVKKYIDDYDVYLEGYAEQQAIDAEKAAKKYTDEKISQIEVGSGISQEDADKRYIRKVVDNFDSDLTFAVADGIVGTDDEYYFIPAKAPSTASDSQILATKADVNKGGGDTDTSNLATKDELNNLTNEVIANEEVHAAALNDLNERKADKEYVENALKNIDTSDLATKEEVQNLTDEIIANEEVHAAALNDLNERKADKDKIAAKQDIINDLDAIRNGAALGATALQSVPDSYATKDNLAEALAPIGTLYKGAWTAAKAESISQLYTERITVPPGTYIISAVLPYAKVGHGNQICIGFTAKMAIGVGNTFLDASYGCTTQIATFTATTSIAVMSAASANSAEWDYLDRGGIAALRIA